MNEYHPDWTPEQLKKLDEWLEFIRRNGGEVPVAPAPYPEDGSYPNKEQVDSFITLLEAQMRKA